MGRGHPKIPTYCSQFLSIVSFFLSSSLTIIYLAFWYFAPNTSSMRFIICFFSCLLLFTSCKRAQNGGSTANTNKAVTFELLDQEKAKIAIQTDSKEGYFETVRPLEMCIQMDKELSPNEDLKKLKESYINYLEEDVDLFSEEDIILLKSVEDSINILLKDVNPKWLKKEIFLVKLKAKSYGEGVFYTRDNGIFIPYNELDKGSVGGLVSVFLHEIYHIMSRYNEDFRRASYDLIGFHAVEGNIHFPEALDKRILLNPDGVNMAYAISLKTDKEEDEVIRAIPVIHTNTSNYSENKPAFFSYIQFDLFRIESNGRSNELMISDEKGPMVTPDIPDLYYPSFFEQIYDNTQYIIHPDEIMADNFMFAIFAKNGDESFEFSEKGSQLIESLQNLIFVE